MNAVVEPMLDFLQCTLGKRSDSHNHHRAFCAVFFVGAFRGRAIQITVASAQTRSAAGKCGPSETVRRPGRKCGDAEISQPGQGNLGIDRTRA
jgi:hypothetical protein